MNPILERFINRLIDQSTPEKPLWNIEAIKQGKKPQWNYIDGCMMTSLLSLYEATKDEKYVQFVKRFIDYYVDDNGHILGYNPTHYSTDDICESRVLFDLYKFFHEEKYLKAIHQTYQQIKDHPRTIEGNFWHKKIYPHQVWLDGLFMAMPFYTKYERYFNNKRHYDDIKHQFKVVRKRMFDEKKKLYYHGYDALKSIFWADPKTGLSQNFWLRAMGWYMVAIVDVYEDFDDPKERESFFKPLLKEMVDGLLMYQDKKTSLFYQVVDKGKEPGNYLETSGSALISYAILKAVRYHMLPTSYQEKGLAIFHGITQKYLHEIDGKLNLGGICLVAGLGPKDNLRRDGSYAYYLSEPVVENDAKGVAPLIMAYTEVLKTI